MSERPNFKSLVDKWPSSFVAREKVAEFTGGTVSSRYLANLDSLGKGPDGRIRIGRKVAYPVDLFVKWLQARSKVLDGEGGDEIDCV